MNDVIIVGAGPAGITAAVYAARKKMRTLVLTKNIGGQAALSGEVENYTGFQFITGIELAQKFEEHLKGFDIDVRTDVEASCINKEGDHLLVNTPSGELAARTVILATGRRPRNLNIPGEQEFRNRGVTWCATCDAPLFSGMDVAVIGGGNSAMDAAIQLDTIANKVYLVNLNEDLAGDAIMKEKLLASEKVEVLNLAETKEIIGDDFVTKLKVLVDGEERLLAVGGVFIEIGSVPVNAPACEAKKNDWGEVIVNERCETNVPGLFAAGDVTNIPEKQIIAAAGQGCIALLSAFKYLSTHQFDKKTT